MLKELYFSIFNVAIKVTRMKFTKMLFYISLSQKEETYFAHSMT